MARHRAHASRSSRAPVVEIVPPTAAEVDQAMDAMIVGAGNAETVGSRIEAHYRDKYRGDKTCQCDFDKTVSEMYAGAPITPPAIWPIMPGTDQPTSELPDDAPLAMPAHVVSASGRAEHKSGKASAGHSAGNKSSGAKHKR